MCHLHLGSSRLHLSDSPHLKIEIAPEEAPQLETLSATIVRRKATGSLSAGLHWGFVWFVVGIIEKKTALDMTPTTVQNPDPVEGGNQAATILGGRKAKRRDGQIMSL